MWAQLINALLGLWLMVAPAVFGFEKTIANNDHIVGPVIATFAITALFESTRAVRKFNWLSGAWLLAAPFVLGYHDTTATINDLLVGALVIGLSCIKGRLKYRFAGGWPSLWQEGKHH